MFATVLRQVRPPSPLAGRLGIQSLLFALGEGTFMTGSAVFFTQIVGLTAARSGWGWPSRARRASSPPGRQAGRPAPSGGS